MRGDARLGFPAFGLAAELAVAAGGLALFGGPLLAWGNDDFKRNAVIVRHDVVRARAAMKFADYGLLRPLSDRQDAALEPSAGPSVGLRA